MSNVGRMFFHRFVFPAKDCLFGIVVIDIDSIIMRSNDKKVEAELYLRDPLSSVLKLLEHLHFKRGLIKGKYSHSTIFATNDDESPVRRNANTSTF